MDHSAFQIGYLLLVRLRCLCRRADEAAHTGFVVYLLREIHLTCRRFARLDRAVFLHGIIQQAAVAFQAVADVRIVSVKRADVFGRRFDLRLCERKIPLVLPCDHNTVISLLFCPADDLFLRLRVGLLADSVRVAHVQIDRLSRFGVS